MSRRIKNYVLDSTKYTGSGDDTAVRDCVGTEGFDEFCLLLTAGEARVFASLDGTTFMTKQLVLCQEPPNSGDTISSQDPVFVGKASANVPAWFFGNYKTVRIQQEGGTLPVGVLSASGEKFS